MKPSHLQQLQICNAIMPTGFCILTTTNKLCQNTCNHFIYTKRCFQNHFFCFVLTNRHTHTQHQLFLLWPVILFAASAEQKANGMSK